MKKVSVGILLLLGTAALAPTYLWIFGLDPFHIDHDQMFLGVMTGVILIGATVAVIV